MKVYFWERKAHMDAAAEEQRLRLKQAKLRLVFECQWDGMVRLKVARGQWEAVYLVVQVRTTRIRSPARLFFSYMFSYRGTAWCGGRGRGMWTRAG